MHEAAVTRLELGGELQRAVEEEQFELHFQPIVDLDERRSCGAEALSAGGTPTRAAPPGRVPAARGGDRPDHAAWAAGCSRRPRARLRRWQTRSPGTCRSTSARTSRCASSTTRDRRRSVRDALARRAASPPTGSSSRSPRASSPTSREAPHAPPAPARARRPPRRRRLRHRLLVAQLPPALPDRHAEDRPLVRRARAPASSSANLVSQHRAARRRACTSTSSPRASRTPSRRRSSGMGVTSGQGFHFAKPLEAGRFTAMLARVGRARARQRLALLAAAVERPQYRQARGRHPVRARHRRPRRRRRRRGDERSEVVWCTDGRRSRFRTARSSTRRGTAVSRSSSSSARARSFPRLGSGRAGGGHVASAGGAELTIPSAMAYGHAARRRDHEPARAAGVRGRPARSELTRTGRQGDRLRRRSAHCRCADAALEGVAGSGRARRSARSMRGS